MANITILGSGGWGTALAVMCSQISHNVSLWSPFEEEIKNLSSSHENPLLKGIIIPENITLTTELDSLSNSDIVVIATPSFAVKSTAELIQDKISKKSIIVNVAKGIDKESLKCFDSIIEKILPDNSLVVLSGPSHAEEVARGIPTSVVAASKDRKAADFVQETLMHSNLRVYTNDDVVGVEIGGALKNIIAVATGMCDGLGLGDNTKAALITRGIAEMSRLGIAMGGKRDTFMGLSGLGDLIVTCTSMHSRNRRFGILVGEGCSIQDALTKVGMTVEGYHAAKMAYELSKKFNIEMPISEQCYNVLYNNASMHKAIESLMKRPKAHESETKI